MFVILSVPSAIFSQLFHIKVCGELALNEIEKHCVNFIPELLVTPAVAAALRCFPFNFFLDGICIDGSVEGCLYGWQSGGNRRHALTLCGCKGEEEGGGCPVVSLKFVSEKSPEVYFYYM